MSRMVGELIVANGTVRKAEAVENDQNVVQVDVEKDQKDKQKVNKSRLNIVSKKNVIPGGCQCMREWVLGARDRCGELHSLFRGRGQTATSLLWSVYVVRHQLVPAPSVHCLPV